MTTEESVAKRPRFQDADIQLSATSYMLFRQSAIECSKEEFAAQWDLCPTERQVVNVYGPKPIPRFQKLYGEAGYSFSGLTLVPEPVIPPLVERCLEYARIHWSNFAWNGALVNYYADGTQYIGAHSDDEKDLQGGAPILSFSFGAVRTFRVKQKVTKKTRVNIPTEHGSLIAMYGEMQKDFTHEVPKTKKAGPRINVTVRCFK